MGEPMGEMIFKKIQKKCKILKNFGKKIFSEKNLRFFFSKNIAEYYLDQKHS